jgi:inosine-uridine nucleoside N-ribohydrolase
MSIPIVIDCDPGHDDAIAILLALASPEVELRGITTVAGNQTLDKTTRNALKVLELAGRSDIPVAAGADAPLERTLRVAANVHGETGLDGPALPEPTMQVVDAHAADFLAELIEPGVVLVPTGPLTNVALLLQRHPDVRDRLERIVWMGGAIAEGNVTPAAEFNIWADPEAAAIVLGYGGPLVMAGLDVTYQLQATPERIDQMRVVPGELASTLADLMSFFTGTYVSRHENMRGAAVHDPLAVLALTHPGLFTRSFSNVTIETAGQHTRGMTVIDQRTLIDRPEPNCDRLTSVDGDAAWAVILEAITHFSN